jgi:hypothetical protein
MISAPEAEKAVLGSWLIEGVTPKTQVTDPAVEGWARE